MKFSVEVRPPGSAPGISAGPAAVGPQSINRLAETVARTSERFRQELRKMPAPDDGVVLDSVEISFQLDVRPDATVVLVRPADSYAVSVRCSFKRVAAD